ncbi:FxsA family protein [Pelagibacterium montanilacus]|uniref:FxsA family protein n=1 Tax=Pelagibacterium montanilacus TaxID=2185280 RepID=UPI000F8D39FE|nr:FxsA family protein [Pelagibacterium montanilacus]
MARIILIFILALPFIEIAGFIWVGGEIGVLATIGATILTAAFGILMLRIQGVGLLLDTRAMMARGEVPARQFADAMLLALAGLLLLVPGFFSDLVGLLLLIPPLRHALFDALSRNMVVVTTYSPSGRTGSAPKAIDLDEDEYR